MVISHSAKYRLCLSSLFFLLVLSLFEGVIAEEPSVITEDLYIESLEEHSKLACEVSKIDIHAEKLRPRIKRLRRNLRRKGVLYGQVQKLLNALESSAFVIESSKLQSRQPLNGRGCPYKPLS